ncbi:hypothetical protein J1614_010157 [Plenodomus biglobosus]|nr:hypothetical protein J1614_010157 [Plenodomus biglobosus]
MDSDGLRVLFLALDEVVKGVFERGARRGGGDCHGLICCCWAMPFASLRPAARATRAWGLDVWAVCCCPVTLSSLEHRRLAA